MMQCIDKIKKQDISRIDILSEGKRVFDMEIQALLKTRDALDETYGQILDLIINCKGKIIMTGMGKSGHIAAKLAATFASLGSPAFFLHPAEAMHGDLGMVSISDVVIAISFSGESDEIIRILPNLKIIGAKVVGITGNPNSTLAKESDIVQVLPEFEEACYLGLAPTSSTAAALCYGDSLAVVASRLYGYGDMNYALFHPAGALGKKLILKVKDIMTTGENNAKVHIKVPLRDAIIELSKKGLGAVSVVDENDRLLGIITDGNLRRQLEKGVDVYSLRVEDIMTQKPFTISKDRLAVEALKMLKDNNISCLIVVENGIAIGTLRIQDIIRKGIVG